MGSRERRPLKVVLTRFTVSKTTTVKRSSISAWESTESTLFSKKKKKKKHLRVPWRTRSYLKDLIGKGNPGTLSGF